MTSCPCCIADCDHWATKRCHGADWRIDRCRRCGFGFVFPRPDWETIRRFYLEQGGHGSHATTALSAEEVRVAEAESPGSSLDADRIASRLRLLSARRHGSASRSLRLLDVGCGYGFFSRAARDHGFHVTAIELSDHEAEVSRAIASLEPIRTSFEDFRPQGAFDAIIMSQVLEHAVDPVLWVRKARQILSPGGWLCVAVPNFGGIFQRVLGVDDFMVIPPAHLNYFTPRAMSAILDANGFSSRRIDHITRIPRASLARRLDRFGRFATWSATGIAAMLSRAIDTVRLGGIINVYATRVEAP